MRCNPQISGIAPSEIKIFPEMSYKELMSNNGIKTWLENIQRVGFVLVAEHSSNCRGDERTYGKNCIY